MSLPSPEKIEILSVDLLEQNRPLVDELRRLAASLNLEFGWHYLLDLCWIINQLGEVHGKTVMDAGAGVGTLQWYLASHGARVTSVDRENRAYLPGRLRRRFNVRGLRQGASSDLSGWSQALSANLKKAPGFKGRLAFLAREATSWLKPGAVAGEVQIYTQDLGNLRDIPDGSLDAVASLSAFEHNPPESVSAVVHELLRVLKPGGLLVATLGAAKEADWFHTPSRGWCYTEASLRRIFDLQADVPSNYADYDALFIDLRDNEELRDNLASFYFRSGDNGMPWGIWDPQYQSVGVCKQKRR